jgi:hypothetical protein
MRNALRFLPYVTFVAACSAPPIEQGGDLSVNDRTGGGDQGELLLTGAMSTSPDGRYVVMQRNTTTVLLNVATKVAKELPFVIDRVVFAPGSTRGYLVIDKPTAVIGYDFETGAELWKVQPVFLSSAGARIAKLSEDGKNLIVGDRGRVFVINTEAGKVRDVVSLASDPTDAAAVPGKNAMLVVGTVAWPEHKPSTRVYQLNLDTLTLQGVDVPNCHAPIEVLPDGTRAFMSPTFCEEDKATRPANWTNPDPVSVVDLAATGPQFVRNLPGFGPVSLAKDGSRVIAFVDRERIDASLFDDPSQVPSGTDDQFHLMTIEPKTLKFRLAEIGSALPRFALTRDGKSLLVDASTVSLRAIGSATINLSVDGLRAQASLFGGAGAAPFGRFDLDTQAYVGFTGSHARLDRFVQTADGQSVFTLRATADGLGGDLYKVNLQTGETTAKGCALRDLGLLGDGQTLLLRIRRAAHQDAQQNWYRQESYCYSSDGSSCTSIVDFRDVKPFAKGLICDEASGGHDCKVSMPPKGAECTAIQ